ncbi:vacuolar protein sorting 55 [Aureobasidium pullulans]|uniref:Vacuolar protein sorting 55 n=1 Tax=Aureobasidium pullulans TaxID=5580 RepID=A0A4S9K355_AURPU|nr:vacuolar protein sorting 55 [Aureobasidium pullulans]THW10435.1 vacuolar protein sorting 55 [Aureobasidium pullulans]THY09931.1 vacuolar protein sorting 55 [Aureobasidium pullulans]THY16118.1 vacuolar protein sorting 55 [Aureobasidium pullulans]THY53838.1 vacuolar protein sorting 55 [Aureobasidium pullulans]
MAGLKTIIALSFTNKASKVLAIGFLLVILSSALWHNYLPLLVVATYVIAPVPNWICSRAQSSDDFMDGGSNAVVELGRFITGFLVVMGVALPIVLAHTGMINVPAAAMSIAGGLLIYSTIISFSLSFREDEEF